MNKTMPEIDSPEAVGINLGDMLADYIQDRLTADATETIEIKIDDDKEKRKTKRDYSLEAIGEPLREAVCYNKNVYATKGGDCYRLLPNGSYRYLSKHRDERGDLRIFIIYGKSAHYIKVKRVVANAWLPIPDELKDCYLPWVEHIDGNRDNNHASNLRWIAPAKGYFTIHKK